MDVTSLPSAVMLIVGGGGVEALRRTLDATFAAPDQVWCAVPSEAEEDATLGCGAAVLLVPWPGQRAALAALIERASIGDQDVVQTVIAGSLPDDRAWRRSLRRPGHPRLVLPALDLARGTRGLGSRTVRHAVLRPGAGMTIPGAGSRELAKRGWFNGADLTVAEVETMTGNIQVLSPPRDERLVSPPSQPAEPDQDELTVTVVIPAFNEASCIGDTVRSIVAQSRRADQVIVVDDGSIDETGAIALHAGAQVHRTEGTGSKGAAINAALGSVTSDVVIFVDADTRLDGDAIRHLMHDMERGADATHGSVFPVIERGIWARGRVIEYATALRVHKRVQQALGQIMVLSGCILAIRTDVLREAGGFQARTMVEDLDLTWTLHGQGLDVAYTPRAIAYPTEPTDWSQYKAQMRRWARGFFQSVAVHARKLHHTRALGLIIVAALWDTLMAPIALVILGMVALGILPVHVLLLMGAWHIAWTAVAVLAAGTVVGLRRATACAPAYAVLSLLVSYFYFEALVTEWVLRRRLRTWVKGH